METLTDRRAVVERLRTLWKGILIVGGIIFVAFCITLQPHSTYSKGKTCVECHKEIKDLISKAKVHAPAKESCETCHKRHGFAQKLILVKDPPELCVDCHAEVKDEISGENVHGALVEGGCTTCHDPHASDRPSFLRETESAQPVCIQCHTDLSDAVNAKESHQPFKKGACEECHAAHSSTHPNLLLASEQDVCLRCHQGALENHSIPDATNYECADCHDPHMATKKTPLASYAHDVFASGECASCHTIQDNHVVIESGFPPSDLCATCHAAEAGTLSGSESHFGANDLKSQGTSTCLQCHDPHTSRLKDLAVAAQNDLCRRCHQDLPTPETAGGIPHKPFAEGSCSVCHNPHGGGGSAHLTASPGVLCATCHAEKTAPLEEGETRHAALGAVECDQCHNAHISAISPLLKKEPQDLCFECHDKEKHAAEHAPYASNVCSACHTNHSVREKLLVNTLDNVCAKCHNSILQTAKTASVPHPPAKEESCDFCHSAHGSDNTGVLNVPQKELCASCHDLNDLIVQYSNNPQGRGTAEPPSGSNEKIQATPAPHLHAPFEEGTCSSCHNPHGSANETLLTKQVDDLCYSCHTEEKSLFEKGHMHAPAKDGACLSCHAPHGSSGESLAMMPQPELCIRCHDFSKEPLRSVHKGFDVTRTECTACHSPHNAPDEHLLKPNTHAPFAEGSCDACHEGPEIPESGAAGTASLMPAVSPGVCLSCHDAIAEGQGHQHVEGLACTDCHSPHASKFENLLENPSNLCQRCHEDIMHPENSDGKAIHVHQPIETGTCLDCHKMHDPQSAPFLALNQRELCGNCHQSIKERSADLTQHEPFREGKCGECHATHVSTEDHLLKVQKTALCSSCHDFGSGKMKTAHKEMPLTGTGCTSCHDPHSTKRASSSLVLPVLHPPYEEGDCSACHGGKGAPPTSSALCLECHADGDTFGAVHSGGKTDGDVIVCLDCHSPHAGYETMFTRADQQTTCMQCHGRAEFSRTHVHGALEQGCSSCHDVHNSNFSDFKGEKLNTLCTECHTNASEHAHPLGSEYTDPRTDEVLTCLSCHEPHSSDHEHILTFDKKRDLCIQCHSTGK